MSVINIGTTATDGAGQRGYGFTFLNASAGAAATATGKITSISLLFSNSGTNATGVKVGTFYGSGGSYTLRSYATIGAVTKSSIQTFNSLNIDVVIGDFIGIYYDGGYLAGEVKTGTQYYYSGDAFSGGTISYGTSTGNYICLYGTGDTPVLGKKCNGITISKWNGVLPTKINTI